MTKKGIILFDIDRTLLDTDKTSLMHNELVMKILGTQDIDKIKEVKQKYRETLVNEREYVPEEYLSSLCKAFNSDKIDELLEVYYGDKYRYTYSDAVYPEALSVLNSLSKDYKLGIYSEGTKKFQNNKFRSMNISKYFEEDLIFIEDAKNTLDVISKIPKESIVVDDKETICEFLIDNGIEVIWLNNKVDRKSDKFRTIFSLLELPAIL